MQQMVMNLAVNARDAMPEGGALRLMLEQLTLPPDAAKPLPEMDAGEWIRLTISDTGAGIPADAMPHMFEPFFTTKPPGQGSGLGLAQVHGIVGQHGGHIDVTSQPGVGTAFTIYLPALPLQHADVETNAAAVGVGGGDSAPPALPGGHGETVLVVEDDAVTRCALVETLTQLNYHALEAADGQEALAVVAALEAEENGLPLALVLSDVVMPRMGGLALLRALRARGAQIPVILLTGHPLELETELALDDVQIGEVVEWMMKPVGLAQLAALAARATTGDRATK